jgi:2,4-dienoyl-CoA reductase-like NADH-dependent reductase (Old Yellow Enzyme family)
MIKNSQIVSDTDIKTAISEFVRAAQNAVAAGFDGIELHSAIATPHLFSKIGNNNIL